MKIIIGAIKNIDTLTAKFLNKKNDNITIATDSIHLVNITSVLCASSAWLFIRSPVLYVLSYAGILYQICKP